MVAYVLCSVSLEPTIWERTYSDSGWWLEPLGLQFGREIAPRVKIESCLELW
jgi:hypothetical protein